MSSNFWGVERASSKIQFMFKWKLAEKPIFEVENFVLFFSSKMTALRPKRNVQAELRIIRWKNLTSFTKLTYLGGKSPQQTTPGSSQEPIALLLRAVYCIQCTLFFCCVLNYSHLNPWEQRSMFHNRLKVCQWLQKDLFWLQTCFQKHKKIRAWALILNLNKPFIQLISLDFWSLGKLFNFHLPSLWLSNFEI